MFSLLFKKKFPIQGFPKWFDVSSIRLKKNFFKTNQREFIPYHVSISSPLKFDTYFSQGFSKSSLFIDGKHEKIIYILSSPTPQLPEMVIFSINGSQNDLIQVSWFKKSGK